MYSHFISDELYLAFVLSTRAHAKLISVDTSAALSIPGVVGYVDHTDAPGIVDGTFCVDAVFAKDEVNQESPFVFGTLFRYL